MVVLILFLLGLAVGSFLNVVILRTNTGMSIGGRSRCFSCLQNLSWYDLIPLVSFLIIRGRCRYCGSRVSFQYPLVELVTGTIFVLAGINIFENNFSSTSLEELLMYGVVVGFFSILVAISVYDLRHKIIPDQFSFSLLMFAVLWQVVSLGFNENITLAGIWGDVVSLNMEFSLMSDIASALLAFLFFSGVWFISRGLWMGFGDAKIVFSMGLFLGHPGTLVALLIAFWLGALVGIAMLVFGHYGRKTEVPFAPFLALGAFLSFLIVASDQFIYYYKYIQLL